MLIKLTKMALFDKVQAMTKKQLNNCLVLHIHKCITDDECDLTDIVKEFIMVKLMMKAIFCYNSVSNDCFLDCTFHDCQTWFLYYEYIHHIVIVRVTPPLPNYLCLCFV